MSVFSFNRNSKNFTKRKAWTFKVGVETVEWKPEEPFLFASSAAGEAMIAEINTELATIAQGCRSFDATPTGPELLADLSNPHTVAYLVNLLYEHGWVDEDNEEDMVKYSATAPKLATIFGPQDEGIIY